jgi:hypothetical protein
VLAAEPGGPADTVEVVQRLVGGSEGPKKPVAVVDDSGLVKGAEKEEE